MKHFFCKHVITESRGWYRIILQDTQCHWKKQKGKHPGCINANVWGFFACQFLKFRHTENILQDKPWARRILIWIEYFYGVTRVFFFPCVTFECGTVCIPYPQKPTTSLPGAALRGTFHGLNPSRQASPTLFTWVMVNVYVPAGFYYTMFQSLYITLIQAVEKTQGQLVI